MSSSLPKCRQRKKNKRSSKVGRPYQGTHLSLYCYTPVVKSLSLLINYYFMCSSFAGSFVYDQQHVHTSFYFIDG